VIERAPGDLFACRWEAEPDRPALHEALGGEPIPVPRGELATWGEVRVARA
jgi:hypothetical protein